MRVWETRGLLGSTSEAAGSRIWIMEGSDGEGHVHTHSEARCCEISAGSEKIALASGERIKTATNSSSQDKAEWPGDPSAATLEAERQESMAFGILKENIFNLESGKGG